MRQTRNKLYVIATLLLLNININAFGFEVDGIYYNILSEVDKTCEVTSGGSSEAYSGTVFIPEIVNYNNTDYTVIAIGNYAFENYSTITDITVPSSITTIGQGAFRRCSALEHIIIPNSVESIGGWAFSDCIALTDINIPHSVKTIGTGAFSRCPVLAKINVENGNTNYCSQDGVLFNYDKTILIQCPGGKSGEYIIPSSVTTINNYAFNVCTSLTNITIPSSVTTISGYAFSCCSSITNVIMPNSVTTIDEYVFSDCSALENVTISNSIKTINRYAFSGCSAIKNITIPNSVTIIDNGAFSGCSALTEINIPNSVTTIGETAFSDCSSLTHITIPNSVKTIGEYAFSNCLDLTEINVENGNINYSSENGVLFNYDKTTIIQCPGGKTGEYIIPISTITIGCAAFQNCSALTDITIPNTVKTIENNAFIICI